MKTKSSEFGIFAFIGRFFSKIATAIVSGLPREKYILKPENKSNVESIPENYKIDEENRLLKSRPY
jgi:hypothetical protein